MDVVGGGIRGSDAHRSWAYEPRVLRHQVAALGYLVVVVDQAIRAPNVPPNIGVEVRLHRIVELFCHIECQRPDIAIVTAFGEVLRHPYLFALVARQRVISESAAVDVASDDIDLRLRCCAVENGIGDGVVEIERLGGDEFGISESRALAAEKIHDLSRRPVAGLVAHCDIGFVLHADRVDRHALLLHVITEGDQKIGVRTVGTFHQLSSHQIAVRFHACWWAPRRSKDDGAQVTGALCGRYFVLPLRLIVGHANAQDREAEIAIVHTKGRVHGFGRHVEDRLPARDARTTDHVHPAKAPNDLILGVEVDVGIAVVLIARVRVAGGQLSARAIAPRRRPAQSGPPRIAAAKTTGAPIDTATAGPAATRCAAARRTATRRTAARRTATRCTAAGCATAGRAA